MSREQVQRSPLARRAAGDDGAIDRAEQGLGKVRVEMRVAEIPIVRIFGLGNRIVSRPAPNLEIAIRTVEVDSRRRSVGRQAAGARAWFDATVFGVGYLQHLVVEVEIIGQPISMAEHAFR